MEVTVLVPTITSGKFTIKNGGTVEMDTLKVTLTSTRVTVEKNGTITGEGHGYPYGCTDLSVYHNTNDLSSPV
jgi:hypothetical protein